MPPDHPAPPPLPALPEGAVHIAVESHIQRTPRALQAAGMFDLDDLMKTGVSRVEWDVALPLTEKPWHIGLICGPSGSGKSTIAAKLFAGLTPELPPWPADRTILDGFPEAMGIKDVIAILSSVGFSSPPEWFRPYRVLSTGQKFRADLARILAYCPSFAVVDEFTSTVDRTVAQIGSHAVAKTVRARGQRLVCVTCHEDVKDWLCPDWVYRPAERLFAWRSLCRRPGIELAIQRCHHSAWSLFASHHYLSGDLNKSAVCFLACWKDRPVAFSAWLPLLAKGGGRREHRTVTLPDYQGAGIGNAVSATIASMWKGLGFKATSTTTHPAMMQARRRSGLWRMHRAPSLAKSAREKRMPGLRHANTRLTASFVYTGPAMPRREARRLLNGA